MIPMACTRSIRKSREQGYVLLTLLLVMALLVIATGIAASSIAFNIRRDREEELIHRGAQYRRAIREFVKKTGQYPARLEQLDNTNGRRFIRKHYKDPVTGKDFKPVYLVDTLRQSPTPSAAQGNLNASPGSDAGTPPSNSGEDSASHDQSVASGDPQGETVNDPTNPQRASGSSKNIPSTSGQLPPTGLIVGVVSTSTKKTIREFSGKRNYDQWRFYYHPAFDQYFLMNAPTVLPTFQSPSTLGAEGTVQIPAAPSPQPAPQPQPPSQ